MRCSYDVDVALGPERLSQQCSLGSARVLCVSSQSYAWIFVALQVLQDTDLNGMISKDELLEGVYGSSRCWSVQDTDVGEMFAAADLYQGGATAFGDVESNLVGSGLIPIDSTSSLGKLI